MASSLGSPFSVDSSQQCNFNFTTSNIVNSDIKSPANIALIAVEGVCFVALIILLCLPGNRKHDRNKKEVKDKWKRVSVPVMGMLATLAVAIPLIVLKSMFTCIIKRYYIYFYAVLGLTWRSTELVTAALIWWVVVHHLRQSGIETRYISQLFAIWICIMFALNLSSYILYLLWIIPLLEGKKPSYSTSGFGNDYSFIDFGYQLAYLILSLGFLVAVTYTISQRNIAKQDRNLLLLIVISLLIREIDQVVVNFKSDVKNAALSTTYVLIDTIIYDITTICALYGLFLIVRRNLGDMGLETSADEGFGTIWREATGKGGVTVQKSSEAVEYPIQDEQHTTFNSPPTQQGAMQYPNSQFSPAPYTNAHF